MKKLILMMALSIPGIFAPVNGQAASEEGADVATAKYRPLVEEYTGLWCGNCPSGWVAVEELRDEYGEDFVYVTYHVNDLLQPMMTLPAMPQFVPAIAANRGKPQGVSTIYSEYPQLLEDREEAGGPIADLTLEIAWADASRRALKADLGVTFMKDMPQANYQIEMILTADGLKDDAWGQSNFYAGGMARPGKYWEIFTKGSAILYGLEYNGVAISSTVDKGLRGALPSAIEAGMEYSFSASFDMSEGLSARGVQLIRNKEMLRVVALVKEKLSGKVVNSISSCLTGDISDTSAAKEIESGDTASEITEECYYDLQGVRLESPSSGTPYILRRRYADGRTETLKAIAR